MACPIVVRAKLMVMVKVKDAVKNATAYFVDIMDGNASGTILEEVEPSEDGTAWLVTLSA